MFKKVFESVYKKSKSVNLIKKGIKCYNINKLIEIGKVMKKRYEETIVGIATAFSKGAISIVRLSGDDSIKIANSVFKGKNLEKVNSHTVTYGHIVDYKTSEVIDEVLVSVFKEPRTYTRENVVEINCHGGVFVTNQIYENLLLAGAKPAEPGEFTKRAFLNGRIDLTKAEAVMDIIDAENKNAVKLANAGLSGKIANTIRTLRQDVVNILAVISVNIDYPEYDDVEELTNTELLPKLVEIKNYLETLLENSKSAKYLKDGINVAIIGKPNVGKSSLLNLLLGESRAIVTDIPGTTRDIIEAKVNINNITLNLLDTAGIRDTSDIVEQIGVSKAKESINKADLVLMVVDTSQTLDETDLSLYNMVVEKPHILIGNKSDLVKKADLSLYDKEMVYISALNSIGLEELENKITEVVFGDKGTIQDATYISNARQVAKLNEALNALNEAIEKCLEKEYVDIIDIHIREAYLALGEIIGDGSIDSLIDELFSKFCLGK